MFLRRGTWQVHHLLPASWVHLHGSAQGARSCADVSLIVLDVGVNTSSAVLDLYHGWSSTPASLPHASASQL